MRRQAAARLGVAEDYLKETEDIFFDDLSDHEPKFTYRFKDNVGDKLGKFVEVGNLILEGNGSDVRLFTQLGEGLLKAHSGLEHKAMNEHKKAMVEKQSLLLESSSNTTQKNNKKRKLEHIENDETFESSSSSSKQENSNDTEKQYLEYVCYRDVDMFKYLDEHPDEFDWNTVITHCVAADRWRNKASMTSGFASGILKHFGRPIGNFKVGMVHHRRGHELDNRVCEVITKENTTTNQQKKCSGQRSACCCTTVLRPG